jgi:hypothetical protein
MSNSKNPVDQLADVLGGSVDWAVQLPDGSGVATASSPLPEDHWIYGKGVSRRPPMSFLMGTADPRRREWAEKIRAAAQYAIRGATMNGGDTDFDPDAIVQNLIVGLLGYWTPDGLSSDGWDNPDPPPSPTPAEAGGGF